VKKSAQSSERERLESATHRYQQAHAATTTGRYSDALRLVEEGLDLIASLPPSEEREHLRFALTLERGWARRFLGDYTALSDFQDVRQNSPVHAQRSEALVGIGDCYSKLGDYIAAENAYNQALEETRDTGATLCRVRAWDGLGTLCWKQGRMDEAVRLLTQARMALRHTRDAFVLGNVLLSLGIAYAFAGRLDQAISAYEEALDCFRSLDDGHGMALVLNNLGEAHQELFNVESALHYHEEAVRLASNLGILPILLDATRNMGVDLVLMGRYSEGMMCLEKALAQAREAGDKDLALQALYSMGDASLRQGRVAQALDLAAQLEAEASAVGSALHITRARMLRGRIHLAQGNRRAAQAVLQEALTSAHALPSHLLLWQLHAALGRASEDPEVARLHLQIAADFIHQTADPLPDPALRARFLEAPEVQAVLRAAGR
jgi:tetratricopeptide (TPR) repeat protein